ncbi:MAG: efflux RND transporter periplasmic adaptor subunit [Prevotellaceae bacterium]|jgi:cobalt-zinc-cadmium efflux system membrane fusion protein|nr:efflux RND transporter periplasmic adaptor subunit [Prevotellaceae bacterium]
MKKVRLIPAIALASALVASCGQSPKKQSGEESHEHGEEITLTEAQMKTVDIQLGKIEMRDLNSVIRVNGQLDLDPQKKAEVTSLTSGIVKQVLVTEGKFVSAGQALAYLENTEIVELQKNYLVLKKETLISEQEYSRQEELSAQGAGVQKSLQQAAATYEITKAQLAGLEKQLRQLSISPEQVSTGNMATQIPLRSPIAGYVNKINVSTGSFVDMQTSLMSITDNSGIHCDVKIFEKDINLIRIGQEVSIMLTNQPSKMLKGEIHEINKSFEDDTKAILAHVTLKTKTDAKLLPGMYVTALINTGRQKTASVPNDAIVSKDGKKYIFVLEEDKDGESEAEENGDEHGKSFHFSAVEVVTGVSELGYTQVTPVGEWDENATIVKSNAFYVGSMSTEHGEHGH